MIRAAWWSCACACALFALAGARIYERCELARELHSLGVSREHLSTWVCITYHESRFDTAARNEYSGDHGLFQISQLYWCGPGKACGLPCSSLRDEDISNDLECALRIHEEHTRIQGDGFLAWVVYPQHCKHNTKKYIVDCDSLLKNGTVRTPSRSRTFDNPYQSKTTFQNNLNIDDLKPPYLAVNALIRGGYGKMLDESNQKDRPVNWLNYKIPNIDELKLPVFSEKSYELPKTFLTPTRFRTTPATLTTTPEIASTTTTTAATTTSTEYPPIKVWRRIETNQFRKKIKHDSKKPTPEKWLELGKPSIPVNRLVPTTQEPTTVRPSTAEVTTVSSTFAAAPSTVRTTLSTQASVSTTSSKPTTVPLSTVRWTLNELSPKNSPKTTVQTFASRPSFVTTAKAIAKQSEGTSTSKTITYKPFTFTTARPITRTTTSKPTTRIVTVPSSTVAVTTNKPVTFTRATVPWIIPNIYSTSTAKIEEFKTPEPKVVNFFQTSTSTKIPLTYIDFKPRNTLNFSPSTTTKQPFSTLSANTTSVGLINSSKASKSSRTSRLLPYSTSTTVGTNRPFAFTNKPLASSTRNTFTTKGFPTSTTVRPNRPFTFTTRGFPTTTTAQTNRLVPFTSKPFASTTTKTFTTEGFPTSTTVRPNRPFTFTSKPFASTTRNTFTTRGVPSSAPTVTPSTTQRSLTTQSIFDLYLNPVKPKLRTLKFREFSNSAYKLRIFSDGTTTPVPVPASRTRS